MKPTTYFGVLCTGTVLALAGCAAQPEPPRGVIYAEPVFDKYGNPSCRPANVPISGAYSADLALCPVLEAGTLAIMSSTEDGTDGESAAVVPAYVVPVVVDPVVPPVDPVDPPDDETGPPYQQRNQGQGDGQGQGGN